MVSLGGREEAPRGRPDGVAGPVLGGKGAGGWMRPSLTSRAEIAALALRGAGGWEGCRRGGGGTPSPPPPGWGSSFHVLNRIRIQQIPNHLLVGSFVQPRLLLEEIEAGPAQRNRDLDVFFPKGELLR